MYETGAKPAIQPAIAQREEVRYGSVKTARRVNLAIKVAIALLASLFSLYPVVWIISAALNPANSLANSTLIPTNASLDNFQRMVNDTQHPFFLWIWNSVKVASITSIIVVALTALASYSFSRFRYRGRRTGLLAILLVQLFPNMLSMVALYLMLLNLGNIVPWLGLNTHGGLILIYTGGALGFNTWLMKGFFDSIPRELDEAALIDGASPFQVFWRIILPLSRPILAVMGILAFIGVYGDFLLARVMLKSNDTYTLMVGLGLFIQGRTQEWGVFAAAALIGALPIVAIFLILQKQLISGLASGAVKG
jgi:ABC-type maltose transport system permease subunit